MIVVAGFNTAIDRRIELAELRRGEVLRAREAVASPGGKGLHVAQTIAALGEPVQLVGLIDTAQRAPFERALRDRGVQFHGIEVPAIRTCLLLREADGRTTEILEPGPWLADAVRDELFSTFRKQALRSRLAVLSGSLPPGCPEQSYAELVRELQAAGVRCLVDTSGAALQHALHAAPFLLKPNREEAAALLQQHVDGVAAGAACVRQLATQGVAQPLLSLGAAGALLGAEAEVWHAHVDIAAAVSAVGSGDCMLAGVAVALTRNATPEATLRLGVACGAANAACAETGFAPHQLVQSLLPRVRVERMSA
jgi:tagatose 6-phosphate kinase